MDVMCFALNQIFGYILEAMNGGIHTDLEMNGDREVSSTMLYHHHQPLFESGILCQQWF